MAYDIKLVANALLGLAYNNEEDDLMSNMKLQKLLYYEQAYFLVKFDAPLFEEEIEAWKYGPVVPQIYSRFSTFHKQGIMPDLNISLEFKDKEEEGLFKHVYGLYSQYSALGLMELTHKEAPWREAIKQGIGTVITKDSIKNYFSQSGEPIAPIHKNTEGLIRKKYLSRLEDLRRLEFDWNGEQDHPIEEGSFRNMKDLLFNVSESTLNRWALFPSPNGTLYLTMKGGKKAGISIGNEKFSFAAQSDQGIIKGEYDFSVGSVLSVFNSIEELLG